MEAYEIYLILHILSAMVWFGGSVLVGVFGMRAQAAQDPARALAFAKDLDATGKVFGIAGFSTALWGILMVVDAPAIEWEQTWIAIGFIGVIIGAALGIAFYGPQGKKVIAELEAGDAAAGPRMARIAMVSRLELVVLVIVVWAMVTKPGL